MAAVGQAAVGAHGTNSASISAFLHAIRAASEQAKGENRAS
jgi:hypothetical protein